MNLIYRRYRCLYENGWWYTWHKVLHTLLGWQDPEMDPRWPEKKRAFQKQHPERFSSMLEMPLVPAEENSVTKGNRLFSIAVDFERKGKIIWKEQQNEVSLEEQKKEIESFSDKPLISIIMPLYNSPVKWLEIAIESILNQSYTNWELCMVDDGSKDLRGVYYAKEAVARDHRIRFQRNEENGGISTASNVALKMASGEYIALIDQDDAIPPDAFYWFVKEINKHPDADFLYSDECKTDASDKINPSDYYFKPDWSLFLLLNHMYTGHLTMYRTKLVREVGGFRSQYDFSQDYDLALRMADATKNIYHIERILYYWRIIPSSGASGGKPFARLTNIAATHDWCKRHGMEVTHDTVDSLSNFGQVKHKINPLISIVIPTDSLKMLSHCIDGINGPATSYHNVEIIPVTNSMVAEQIAHDYPYMDNIKICRYDDEFNFSKKCNEGAKIAEGDYIIFYNDDVYPFSCDWIERLLDIFSYPNVGGASPVMLHEDQRIQYAGMITGTPGQVGTSFNGQPYFENVPMVYKQYLVRNVSVLCGACMMVRKSDFFKIGGFDEINTPNGHSDVDISFKLMELGKECVYTPFSKLTHIGNHSWAAKSKKDKYEIFCLKRWSKYIAHDRYFTDSMRRAYYWDFQTKYQTYYPENFEWDFNRNTRDILFVSHELSMTGAPHALYNAVRHSIEEGDFCVILCPQDGPMRQEFLKLGAVVIIDEGHNFLFRQFARNFDLVVANTLSTYWAIEHLNGDIVDVVWWVHEGDEGVKCNINLMPSKLEDNIHVYCASEYSDISLKKYGFNYKTNILRLGVLDKISDYKKLPQEKKIFLTVGSIEKRKGQKILMDSISMLPNDVKNDAEFYVIGKVVDQNYKDDICKKLPDNVHFLDVMKQEELMKYYSIATAVIIPSTDEPTSMVGIEGLMLEIPVICSTRVGLSAFLKNGESALIFENKNAVALSEIIVSICRNSIDIKKIGKAGRTVFENTYDSMHFKNHYDQLVNKYANK